MILHHHRSCGAPSPRPMRKSEHGVIGGVEVLPFGVLIFVVGALIIVNAWAVIDAKLAVETAAREAGRAYVESEGATSARRNADAAARSAVAGMGRDPNRLVIEDNSPVFERCAMVEHEVTYQLPALTVPFLGTLGSGTEVHGRHREVIDPYSSGNKGEADCG